MSCGSQEIENNSVKLEYPEGLKCPCGTPLICKSITPEGFPYIHVDLLFTCPKCGKDYLFGIPSNHQAGTHLQIWDSNPKDSVTLLMELPIPECPWHSTMIATKVWGDWVYQTEEVRYQWKCPICYYIEHKTTTRHFPHLNEMIDLDRKILEERLRKLGYLPEEEV